ncbi:MAG: DUF488 family protein [Sedimentisphaerales bacterium]|nr:DUF488 family protein [Sedimentisphaerales bacterium]
MRRFPGLLMSPHFNLEVLEKALSEAGIEHFWLEDLGGQRSAKDEYTHLLIEDGI